MLSEAGLPHGYSSGECGKDFVPLRRIGMMLYPPGPFFSCAWSGRSDLFSGGL